MRGSNALFALFLFFALSVNLKAQQNKIVDSLLQAIIKSKADSMKGWNFLELAKITSNSNPFISKYYANKGKEIFNKLGHKTGLASACLRSATALRMMNEENAMLDDIKRALSIAENSGNNLLLASCFQEMALISNAQNDLDKSLSYNLKALDIRKKLKHTKENANEISGIYNNIGIEFARKEKWEEAVQYFRTAIAYDEKTNNHYRLGNTYNNVGISS